MPFKILVTEEIGLEQIGRYVYQRGLSWNLSSAAMASQSVASALSVLTSDGFSFTSSDSPDNCALEALVQEYFTGNDEITDCETSDSDAEGTIQKCISLSSYIA